MPTLARPLRIATFNIRHGAPPDRSVRPFELRRAVRGLGVELLAMQEVDRRVGRSWFLDEARWAARACGLVDTFAPARHLGPGGRYGVALLSATRPRAVEVIRLPSFGAEQRVALMAAVDVGGVTISVAVAHLHHRSWIALEQLDVVLGRLSTRAGPHLLMGDLNVGRDQVGTAIADAGLTTVSVPPTFPTWAPAADIDWIAVGGLDVLEATVVELWASDHFPMVATVQ
ncbi:MAG: endonuclease/exonuclease/phosphatase family protein [Microthrixaceae bacterium]